jgi:NAD-dependent SIR2 family protein deacetylase
VIAHAEDTRRLGRWLARHRRVLALTGAGISAPSGIPAYRDADGAWQHRRPMSLADFLAGPANRRRYWARSVRGWPRVRDAQPNPAHLALAQLEACGPICGVVSQNVDGLHGRAGSRRVVDLHGRLDTVECTGCAAVLARDDVQQLLLTWNPPHALHSAPMRPDGDADIEPDLREFAVPDCPQCGGVLKPAVVFFGENVPRRRVDVAMAALAQADALLIVGSSLMVYSGLRFVLAARALGRPVAALNLGRTRADEHFELKIETDCAEVLPALAG